MSERKLRTFAANTAAIAQKARQFCASDCPVAFRSDSGHAHLSQNRPGIHANQATIHTAGKVPILIHSPIPTCRPMNIKTRRQRSVGWNAVRRRRKGTLSSINMVA